MRKTIITAALAAADPALDELGERPVWGSDDAIRCMTRQPAASLFIPPFGAGRRECRASRNRAEGHGSGVEPGSAAVRDSPAYRGAERIQGGGGNWGGPPRPDGLRVLLPERGVL